MEEVLLPVMYDIPSRDDVEKVVVTKRDRPATTCCRRSCRVNPASIDAGLTEI